MTINFAAELERRRARAITWWLPLPIRKSTNGSHGHWTTKARIAAEHHEEAVTRAPKDIVFRLPVVVVLRRYHCGARTRMDPRDNLPAALKYVTDGVAEVIGVDDADDTIFRPVYEQEAVAKRKDEGVLITVIQSARIIEAIEFVG